MSTEQAPEQHMQGDPNATNDADRLAEATLAMIGGGRNFDALSAQQKTTYEELTKEQVQAVQEPEQIDAPTTDPEPASELTEPEPEATASASEPEPAADPELPAANKREKFRFANAEDKAIAQLAVAKGIGLARAAELYAKLKEPESKPEPTSEPVVATPATSPTVKALEAEVAALETQLDGFVDGIHTAESIKATRDYARKVAQLERARSDAERAAADDIAFETRRDNVMQEMVKAFPDMANRNSAQYLIAARLADEASNPKHPDYKTACSMDAPRFFAQKAAEMLKIKPAAAASPAVKSAVAKPAAVNKPVPASGTRQTQPPKAAKPEADQLAEKLAGTLDMISGGRGQQTPSTILIN